MMKRYPQVFASQLSGESTDDDIPTANDPRPRNQSTRTQTEQAVVISGRVSPRSLAVQVRCAP
jgi:hypothetical protein